MPLVTVTTRAGKTPAWKRAVLDGVHRALVASGVPEADRFQRIIELGPDDFLFDPRYPDAASPRTSDFVLIELLWSVGRSVKVKRKFLADLTAALRESPGLDAENVMLVFKETQWENWAFAGGRLAHASRNHDRGGPWAIGLEPPRAAADVKSPPHNRIYAGIATVS